MSLRRVLFFALSGLFLAPCAFAGTKLLRFPDICGDKVVFTYAGDLWTASTQGGTATRLTAGPGVEQSARFSPDCTRIAFTGEYGGDDQVYVMPAGGGEPTQLTWYPAPRPAAATLGFRQPGLRLDAGRQRGAVPLLARVDQRIESAALHGAHGGRHADAAADADGRRRTLFAGRHADGVLAEVPRFPHLGRATSAAGRRTCTSTTSRRNRPRTSPTIRTPTAIRSGSAARSISCPTAPTHLNLYRYDTASGETKQLTSYKDVDARWASGDKNGQIVFEVGRRAARLRHQRRTRIARSTSPCRAIWCARAPASAASRTTSRTSRSAATASARCSPRAARCSACRSRTASRSTSRTRRGRTSARRRGRRTASASPTSPTRVARKRSGCATPMATSRAS